MQEPAVRVVWLLRSHYHFWLKVMSFVLQPNVLEKIWPWLHTTRNTKTYFHTFIAFSTDTFFYKQPQLRILMPLTTSWKWAGCPSKHHWTSRRPFHIKDFLFQPNNNSPLLLLLGFVHTVSQHLCMNRNHLIRNSLSCQRYSFRDGHDTKVTSSKHKESHQEGHRVLRISYYT